MSYQRPSSRPATATHVATWMKRLIKGSFMQGLILCALIPGVALLGACGQREGEAPDPGPTSTATPLPAVVMFTPQPPTATHTPAPTPTESVPATPTPTVTVTETAPAVMEPPTTDASVTVLGEMNVRSGPGIDYDVVGNATAGKEFPITGKNSEGDWWRIDFQGQPGWIHAPLVVAADAEDVPVVGTGMTEAAGPDEGTTEAAPALLDAVVTVGGDMNIRSGPGTDYDRIGGATAGEAFRITGKNEDGEWWQIDFGGATGWIYAPFVTATNAESVPVADGSMSETPASDTETAAPETESATVTILGDMNIRSGPGTDYDRIGGATAGEAFEITGKSPDGEWWQIDFDGQSGWIYAPFVTATNAVNVPVVTPEAQGSTPADSGRRAVVASRSDGGDVLGTHFEEE